MKFDTEYFDRMTQRRGTNSMKWDEEPGVIPLWVADMDFRTAPCIIEALKKRVEHGIFGYTHVPESYFDATIRWFGEKHGWEIDRDMIIYTSGVVPAISAILKAMTRPGDKVVVQTPAYNCFFSSVRNNGCRLAVNELRDTGNGYVMDYEDLEEKLSDPEVKVMILCNPHNPVGRVWTREELMAAAEACRRHNVFVISDEIHCELTFTRDYTSYGTLGKEFTENSAICVSPSKAFNIAGLQIANIVAGNQKIRDRIDRAINDNEVCDVNPFGVIATTEAYNNGEEWLKGLKAYLYNNYQTVRRFFAENFSQYAVTPLEGTYLAWINIEKSGLNGKEFCEMLKHKSGVMLNDGEMYGRGGENFVRLNFACQRATLLEALKRMKEALSGDQI